MSSSYRSVSASTSARNRALPSSSGHGRNSSLGGSSSGGSCCFFFQFVIGTSIHLAARKLTRAVLSTLIRNLNGLPVIKLASVAIEFFN